MGAEHLSVCRSEARANGVDGPVVSIESVVDSVSAERIQEMFVDFCLADVGSDTRLPLYELLWFTVVGPDESLDGLIDFVVLFDGLAAAIEETEPDALVVADDVDERFEPVLRDVANAHDLVLRDGGTATDGRLRNLFGEYLRIALVVVDQLLLALLSLVTGRSDRTEVVFFPQTGREDSMIPVLSASTFEFTVALYPLFQPFRRGYDSDRGLGAFPTRPFDAYAGLGTILAELRFVLSFSRSLLGTPTMEAELTEYVEDTYDNHMPASVRATCRETYGRKLSKVLAVPIARSMFERTGCEAVVVGSSGLPSRGLLYAAADAEVDAYLVPHGITRPHEPLVPRHTTMFVPGSFGNAYLADVFPEERQPRLVPAGRPYLQTQFGEDVTAERSAPADAPLRVILATQNFADEVREAFFRDAIEAIGHREEPTDVVVKAHPSESLELYRDLLAEMTVPDGVDVTLSDGDLAEHLNWADLLVTVNSNVGLESIIDGTPSVAINRWEPTIPNYVYVEAGPVPCLRTNEDTTSFFADFDREDTDALYERERRWVVENYVLEDDAAAAIAEEIDPRIER